MNYYCEIFDKTTKIKSKNILFKGLTHKAFDMYTIKYTIKNPNKFDIDLIFNKYVNNDNKNLDLCLVNCNFKLSFDKEFYPYFESNLYNSKAICYWKKFLLNAIQDFNNKGYNFSHISGMKIITNTDKRHMTYNFYLKHNMQAVEWRLNMIIKKNPNLINALDRSFNHPFIQKYSNIPFTLI